MYVEGSLRMRDNGDSGDENSFKTGGGDGKDGDENGGHNMSGAWRTSTSCQDGSCVKVRVCASGSVIVRDEGGQETVFSRDEWIAFVMGVKNDEFDYDALVKDRNTAAVDA